MGADNKSTCEWRGGWEYLEAVFQILIRFVRIRIQPKISTRARIRILASLQQSFGDIKYKYINIFFIFL
jgi:hypothetical protein